MEYNIIASGSKGNAVVINKNILIDIGVPFKNLKSVYEDIKLVLLTHIHTDHFNSATIKKLSEERPTIRFATCNWLVKKLIDIGISSNRIDVLDIGKFYDYGLFKVAPIKLYHDVPNCGYRIHFADAGKMVYMTDTGHLQGIEAKDYDLYLIEANYDEDKLTKTIKQKQINNVFAYETRVPLTHLSTAQTSEWLLNNMGENSEYVFMHKHLDDKKDDFLNE